MREAIVATEDERFYRHDGIDLIGRHIQEQERYRITAGHQQTTISVLHGSPMC